MLTKYTRYLLMVFVLTTDQLSIAKEDALYGPVAPAGSAFVRVVNLSTSAVEAKTGNDTFRKTAPFSGSDYKFFPPGNRRFSVTSHVIDSQLMPDHYYSMVIATKGPAKIVEDSGKPDPAKSVISVYNVSSQPLISLKTLDGKTPVIENVASDTRGDRSINPVKVKLAVFGSTNAPVDEISPLYLIL